MIQDSTAWREKSVTFTAKSGGGVYVGGVQQEGTDVVIGPANYRVIDVSEKMQHDDEGHKIARGISLIGDDPSLAVVEGMDAAVTGDGVFEVSSVWNGELTQQIQCVRHRTDPAG